jgi:hypothetical protein
MRIEDIEKIGITVDEIILMKEKGEDRIYNRNDYRLFVENVRQIQDESPARERRTAILMESVVDCVIDEGKKTISCGYWPDMIHKV